MLEILRQLAECEILRNAVERPRLGYRLESPQQQLAGVFLEVGAVVHVAHDRQVGAHPFHRVGDDVEVLAGLKRHVDADGEAEIACPDTRAVHDRLCAHRPFPVSTPTARPCSTSTFVTAMFSTIRAPPCRAPRASAMQVSIGLHLPSRGYQTAPTTSSTFINGHFFCASRALIGSASTPNEWSITDAA